MPYKKGLKWKAQVKKYGMRKEKTFATKKEALAWETEVRRRTLSEWNGMINTTCLIDWAEAYMDSCKERFVEKTYKEKQSIFKRFFKEVDPTMDIKNLNPSITQKYFIKQKQDRTGNASNKDRKNLLAGWNWGMIYMNPQLGAPNPFATPKMPEIRQPRYVPPEEDFWKVYELAQGQDQVLLLTYIHLACRRGEAFRLKWKDLDFNKKLTRLWTRKRKDSTWEYAWLPMTNELYNAFSWWKKRCPEKSEFVFICLEKKYFCTDHFGKPFKVRQHFMKKICEKAGVKHFGFHGIRHLSASVLYAAGYTVSTIQKIMRHKNPSTTEKYLRSLGIEDVRDALDSLSVGKKQNFNEKNITGGNIFGGL